MNYLRLRKQYILEYDQIFAANKIHMNKIILILSIVAITFTSCKNDKETDADYAINDTEVSNSEQVKDSESNVQNVNDYNNETQNWNKTKNYTPEESNKMADEITSNVTVNNDTITEIKNYRDYSDMRNYLYIFANSTAQNERENELTLRESFNVFKNTIPYYLRRDDVNDAVRDVEKELSEYEMEKNQTSTSEEERRENIEEIQEAFDDLEKEIVQARKKFEDNKEDAMEEFMEEINSKSDQTQSERYRDAIEEYNEEMND